MRGAVGPSRNLTAPTVFPPSPGEFPLLTVSPPSWIITSLGVLSPPANLSLPLPLPPTFLATLPSPPSVARKGVCCLRPSACWHLLALPASHCPPLSLTVFTQLLPSPPLLPCPNPCCHPHPTSRLFLAVSTLGVLFLPLPPGARCLLFPLHSALIALFSPHRVDGSEGQLTPPPSPRLYLLTLPTFCWVCSLPADPLLRCSPSCWPHYCLLNIFTPSLYLLIPPCASSPLYPPL